MPTVICNHISGGYAGALCSKCAERAVSLLRRAVAARHNDDTWRAEASVFLCGDIDNCRHEWVDEEGRQATHGICHKCSALKRWP